MHSHQRPRDKTSQLARSLSLDCNEPSDYCIVPTTFRYPSGACIRKDSIRHVLNGKVGWLPLFTAFLPRSLTSVICHLLQASSRISRLLFAEHTYHSPPATFVESHNTRNFRPKPHASHHVTSRPARPSPEEPQLCMRRSQILR